MSTNRYHYLFIITAIVLASCGPTAPTPGPLVPTGNVETIESGKTVENVWNCGNGGGTIVKHPSRSGSTNHAVEWGIDGATGYGVTIGKSVIPGGVDLSQSLSGHYQIGIDTGSQQGTSWDLPAEPNTIVDYTLVWHETWETGYVDVLLPNKSSQRINLRYRTNIESTMIDKRVTLCPGSEGASNSTIALSDSFSGSNSGYDTSLWTCLKDSECGAENIILQDDVLNLKRNSEGLTDLLSQSIWDYSELASLSGKIKVSSNSNQSNPNWGWISLHDHVAQCTISGFESPYIQCSVGGNSEGGSAEYYTENYPIKFDTWYSVKMDFDHNSNSIKFYLDNKFIGEYTFTQTPGTVQISLGMYAQTSNDYYIDDILLTLKQ
jgi:hypothetical protein